MKLLLSSSIKNLVELQEQNGVEIYNYSFDCHPTKLKDTVNSFIKAYEEDLPVFTTNNIEAINLFPMDMILWVDKINPDDFEYALLPFGEVFSALKGIRPGDIFMMYCTKPFNRSTKEDYKDTIHFELPELEEL